jgi:DNA-binding CsgD family transcriptional regulator
LQKERVNIAVIESSRIVYEGLSNIITKTKRNCLVYLLNDFYELDQLLIKSEIHIVIINPSAIQNRIIEFTRYKNTHINILWVGIVYSFYDNQLLNHFQETISISDSVEVIKNKLTNSVLNNVCEMEHKQLSEREIDVLTQLVNGLSNKEIASKLNISTHTVISHRKNIVEKTGIKSLPGLTIYAITQNITSVNSTPK